MNPEITRSESGAKDKDIAVVFSWSKFWNSETRCFEIPDDDTEFGDQRLGEGYFTPIYLEDAFEYFRET